MPKDAIISFLRKYDKILLVVHENPDGDTIASSLALFLVLKNLGKKIDIVCKDKIPALFQFLPACQKIKNDFLQGDYEAIFVLDCGDLKRTGFPKRIRQFARQKKCLVNVDHHPKNDLHKVANLNVISQDASSTAEILFDIFEHANFTLGNDIATCLLTGLYTDTGGFKHSNTTPHVLKMAGRLLSLGANLKQISKNISINKSITALKLWGIALSRIWQNKNYGLVLSAITRKDLEKCHATDYDLAGIVNLIGCVPGTKTAIFLAETADGQVRASLRTEEDKIDVSQIACLFGGGGHRKASGFSIEGRLVKDGDGWKLEN